MTKIKLKLYILIYININMEIIHKKKGPTFY